MAIHKKKSPIGDFAEELCTDVNVFDCLSYVWEMVKDKKQKAHFLKCILKESFRESVSLALSKNIHLFANYGNFASLLEAIKNEMDERMEDKKWEENERVFRLKEVVGKWWNSLDDDDGEKSALRQFIPDTWNSHGREIEWGVQFMGTLRALFGCN